MNWATTILEVVNGISPIEAFLLGGLLLYLVIKGIIIIPWIPIGNKIKNKNVHFGCKNYNNLEHIIDEKIGKIHRLYELKSEVIESQMSAADKSMVAIKSMLVDVYKANGSSGRDLRAYGKILDFTLEKAKRDKLKHYILENHFAQKTVAEFTLYKQITTKTLIAYHIMCLDDEYYSEDFDVISRKTLRAANELIMHDIHDELIRLFREIRDIAIKYDQEIKEIEKS